MATNEGCAPVDLLCIGGDVLGDAVSNASNDAIQLLTNQVLEGFGKMLATVGTMWVGVQTPVLSAGSATVGAESVPPESAAFGTILDYVTYVGLAICVLSLVALGGLIALRSRRGEGMRSAGALSILFVAVILISGASALIGGLLSVRAPGGSSTAVGFLQNSLWFYVGALAVLSVIVGGIRMAWEQRAHPGKELVQALITLLLVSGAGLAVVGLGVTAADAFAVWVLSNATDCDVSAVGDSTCFGANLGQMLAIGTTVNPGVGVIGTLILASLALLMAYVQVALMVVRGGLLVILAGVLPLAASFTNTQMGRQWFGKVVGWTIAFILYKPAAALVYAAAIQLAGTDAFRRDGDGLWSILSGLALMLIALIALPALLKFVAPMTGAVVGGGNSGMAIAAAGGAFAGEIATGAVRRHSSAGNPASGRSGGSNAPTGATGGGGPAATGAAAAGSRSTTAHGVRAAGAGTAVGGSGAAAGASGPTARAVLGVKLADSASTTAVKAAKAPVEGAADGPTGA